MNEHLLPVLVTGATGLVGSVLCKLLLGNCRPVLALVRDEKKAMRVLGEHPLLTVQTGDICTEFSPSIPFGEIIHGANPTASAHFIDNPVDTIHTAVAGTQRILELARVHKVHKVVFLSSGEIYGSFPAMETVQEETMGTLDPMLVRSSYPEAKRLCETLCSAYHAQYGVPVVVARLGVIFGPLVDKSDQRLIAQFARCASENRDIVLQTAGGTIRSYCEVNDAARAILCLLEKGHPGSAYNVANPDMVFSVKELAEKVCALYAGTRLKIQDQGCAQAAGYLPELRMRMDVSRLEELGWSPEINFETGFQNTVESIK